MSFSEKKMSVQKSWALLLDTQGQPEGLETLRSLCERSRLGNERLTDWFTRVIPFSHVDLLWCCILLTFPLSQAWDECAKAWQLFEDWKAEWLTLVHVPYTAAAKLAENRFRWHLQSLRLDRRTWWPTELALPHATFEAEGICDLQSLLERTLFDVYPADSKITTDEHHGRRTLWKYRHREDLLCNTSVLSGYRNVVRILSGLPDAFSRQDGKPVWYDWDDLFGSQIGTVRMWRFAGPLPDHDPLSWCPEEEDDGDTFERVHEMDMCVTVMDSSRYNKMATVG